MGTDFAVPGTLVQAANVVNGARGRLVPLRRIFDRSLIPMVLVDNDRVHTEGNAAARLVLRMSLKDLRERRIDDFTTDRELPTMMSAWEELLDRGTVCGRHLVTSSDNCTVPVAFAAMANTLPGQHLIVYAPTALSDDELDEMRPSNDSEFRGPLSVRQLEVLRLIAAGANASEIAAELSISQATARTHVKNILNRLGANNRAHAVALAMRCELLEDHDPYERVRLVKASVNSTSTLVAK